jgi:hypothetical protein
MRTNAQERNLWKLGCEGCDLQQGLLPAQAAGFCGEDNVWERAATMAEEAKGNERKLATSGRPWWPARASCSGGVPAHLRQRHEAWRLRGGTRRLVAGLASPERQRILRIDEGEPTAALGSAAWSGGAGEGAASLGLGRTRGSRPRLYRRGRKQLAWRACRGKAVAAPCSPWTLLADGLQRARLGRSGCGSGLRARSKRIG